MDHAWIAGNATIGSEVFVSGGVLTSNDNAPGRQAFDDAIMLGPTIEDGAMIGVGAILLPNIRIGARAVVAAGAIVTKDVPAYSIVAGNPARIVRRRFPEDIAERLMQLGWWNWEHEALRAALPDFRKLAVEAFLDKYESINVPA